ncbi:uncharacterized protein LOC135378394 [Ornithodoros turicata]|uniref:uncharacterized protein LOC135378394 n=1 Tax=Ornithodoros turicata TaxID=34597 RepID=UPI003139E8F9
MCNRAFLFSVLTKSLQGLHSTSVIFATAHSFSQSSVRVTSKERHMCNRAFLFSVLTKSLQGLHSTSVIFATAHSFSQSSVRCFLGNVRQLVRSWRTPAKGPYTSPKTM